MSDEHQPIAQTARDAGRVVASFVRSHPLEVAAVGAGAGFLFGGGLTRRIRTLLLGAGSRFAAARLAEWVQENAAANADGERGETWRTDPTHGVREMGGTRS